MDIDAKTIAQQANLNGASVWKIFKGRVEPKTKTLKRIAHALGTELPVLSVVSTRALPEKQTDAATSEALVPQSAATAPASQGGGVARSVYAQAWNGQERRGPSVSIILHGAGMDLAAKLVAEASRMASEAAANAIREMIEQSEMDGTRAGRRAIIAWLYETAGYFKRHGAEVDDLIDLARKLEQEGEG